MPLVGYIVLKGFLAPRISKTIYIFINLVTDLIWVKDFFLKIVLLPWCVCKIINDAHFLSCQEYYMGEDDTFKKTHHKSITAFCFSHSAINPSKKGKNDHYFSQELTRLQNVGSIDSNSENLCRNDFILQVKILELLSWSKLHMKMKTVKVTA